MDEARRTIDLEHISEEDLLAARICDLPLTIAGTWLAECVDELYRELEEKGVVFRPQCYLADEWLTPENETCIGIPFFLAHPALTRLEKKIMLEAEGDTREWCMKLLRHEAGHALCYAYRFHKRPKWQKIFGPSTLEYAQTYKFRPYSKNYVRHLDGYYAQYHPDEDFVETFAVWLTPNSNWAVQYQGWGALEKLQYVDRLACEIKGKTPLVKSSRKLWRLSTLHSTLQGYYKKKRRFWAEDFPDFHDVFLKKTFAQRAQEHKSLMPAAVLIQKYRRIILNAVTKYSGERKYVISDLFKDIRKRSQELDLIVVDDETATALSLSTYVTSLIMNYIYTGRFRGEKHKRKK